jgi:uncharacterized membrane protein
VTDGARRAAVAILAGAGAAISAYLTITKLGHSQVVCPTSGCEVVQESAYSKLFGIPVAAFGVVGFVLIGTTALLRTSVAMTVGGVLAVAGAAFALYLVVVQITVIGAVCVWCATSDTISVGLAGVALWRLAATSHASHLE